MLHPRTSLNRSLPTHIGVGPLPATVSCIAALLPCRIRIAQTLAKSPGSLSDSFGSAFTFDFARNPSRPKRPFVLDKMGAWKLRSPETSPVEANGSKALDMRLQGQQEELTRTQREQAELREELATQKV